MSVVDRAESLENSFGQIIHQLQDIKASFKSTFRKDPLFHSGCLCQHTQASFREAHVSALPVGLVEMRKNEELCDAILEVEGRSIPCHRVVLAAGIPYFKAMFTSANMAEANMKKIQLKDLQYDVVCKIVDYAYGSQVIPHRAVVSPDETTEKLRSSLKGAGSTEGSKIKDIYETKPSLDEIHSVLNILHHANMFGMTALEENCCTYLKKFFSLESVVDIFYFCKSHGDAFVSLEAKVTNWIARNFQCVVKQSAFMEIAVAEFLLLISSKAMYVDDEYAVLLAILSWVRHDVVARTPHLKQLLQQTHLHQISDADMKTAMEHPVMTTAPEDIKAFVRSHHRGFVDVKSLSEKHDSNVAESSETSSSSSTLARLTPTSAPTRARPLHVLMFGRKFYLEDTVKDHNLLCIDVETGGIFAFPAPPRAFYGTQLGVSCYNHEVMVHAVSRSELHALVLNRFKRTEGTWDVVPVRHVSTNFETSKSGYVVDNFCRPPVIASTDGTKPFNFLLVSTHEDVDLAQRRQRIRANRKPYNAIFFWEITDDNDHGISQGESGVDLQYCRVFGSNPAGVAAASNSVGGELDLDRFLRHAGRKDEKIVAGLSEPAVVYLRDTLYILDRDVGFYSLSAAFRPRQTPSLVDFRHALDDPSSFPADAAAFFPSRQICGVACEDAAYFVSRTGALSQRDGEGEAGREAGSEVYSAPKVIRYDVEKREWRQLDTPPCPHPASAHLFALKGKVHLFLVQNKPSGRRVTFGWYLLSAAPLGSEEWIPQRWALPALRNYFMHTLESNCVAVTLPSHVLRDGAFLCDKRKHGWTQMDVATDESFGRQATTTGDDEDDDADDEDDEEDADVYRAFQQAMQNQAVDDENADADFDGGNSSSSSSESEEEWDDELDGEDGEEEEEEDGEEEEEGDGDELEEDENDSDDEEADAD